MTKIYTKTKWNRKISLLHFGCPFRKFCVCTCVWVCIIVFVQCTCKCVALCIVVCVCVYIAGQYRSRQIVDGVTSFDFKREEREREKKDTIHIWNNNAIKLKKFSRKKTRTITRSEKKTFTALCDCKSKTTNRNFCKFSSFINDERMNERTNAQTFELKSKCKYTRFTRSMYEKKETLL